jgi:hypothetical protein
LKYLLLSFSRSFFNHPLFIKEYLMNISIKTSIISIAIFASLSLAGPKDLALVRMEKSIDLKGAPAEIWEKLVSPAGQMALGGFKSDLSPVAFTKIGDNQHGACQGDKGTLVVTHYMAGKEIRISFDPDNGAYVCQTRVSISASGTGTHLVFQDWYSEEKAEMKEKNRSEAEKGIQAALEAFKKMAEANAKG